VSERNLCWIIRLFELVRESILRLWMQMRAKHLFLVLHVVTICEVQSLIVCWCLTLFTQWTHSWTWYVYHKPKPRFPSFFPKLRYTKLGIHDSENLRINLRMQFLYFFLMEYSAMNTRCWTADFSAIERNEDWETEFPAPFSPRSTLQMQKAWGRTDPLCIVWDPISYIS
jgi:hypothetical protein